MWFKLCLLVLCVHVLWAHKHHGRGKSSEKSESSSSSRELMKRWASGESGEYGMHRSRGKSDESDSNSEERGSRFRKMIHKRWGMKKHGGRRGFRSGGKSGSGESSSMERRRRHHGKCKHGHKHLFWRHAWGHKKHGMGRRSGSRSSSRESGSRSSSRSSSRSGSRSFERRGKHGRRGRHGRRHHRGGRRHHGGHRRHQKECPAWQPWQQSKCLWPTMDYSSIPEACRSPRKGPRIPAFLQEYKAAKAKEMYDIIQTLFKNRGATKACGYCSRKIQCRVRDESEKMQFGCKPKEFKMVDEECDGHEACQLSVVLGGCPAPMPQKHLQMMQHRKKGHHFGQMGQFHHYGKQWGGGSGERSGEDKRRRRGPRSAEEGDMDIDMGSKSSNETDASSSQEKVPPTSGSGESQEISSNSNSGSAESGEQWGGHHKNHTALPLWHCVKNKDGSKCLCCCGNYFPEVSTGLCKKVKFGSKLPVFDLWSLTAGGMPTGEHK